MKPASTLAILAALPLAACGSSGDRAAPTPETSESATVAAAPAPTASASLPDSIPNALRGRWGLVPEDCNPSRSDNKGLMTVAAHDIRFYESVGTLGKVASGDDASLRASFAFTGEGMEWTRDMSMGVNDDGQTLIRREFGDDAAIEPLRYTRCPA